MIIDPDTAFTGPKMAAGMETSFVTPLIVKSPVIRFAVIFLLTKVMVGN